VFNRNEFASMANLYFIVFVEAILVFAIAFAKEPENRQKLETYLATLREKKERGTAKFMSVFFPTESATEIPKD
jgi:hypothetical protein